MCVRVSICAYACVHVSIGAYVCVYVSIGAYVCVYVSICACMSVYVRMCAYMSVYVRMCAYMSVYVRLYAYIVSICHSRSHTPVRYGRTYSTLSTVAPTGGPPRFTPRPSRPPLRPRPISDPCVRPCPYTFVCGSRAGWGYCGVTADGCGRCVLSGFGGGGWFVLKGGPRRGGLCARERVKVLEKKQRVNRRRALGRGRVRGV